jgi:uncharacterized protein (DUF427 family)/acyl-CoA thioesterase
MALADIESAWPRHPGYAITATPLAGIGRVRHGDVVVAESGGCLVVAESDHRDQLYFPVDDVRWQHLAPTEHHTVCPFKGEASYWSLVGGGAALENVAWSYHDTFDEVAPIRGYVAFYTDRLSVTVTGEWSDDPRDHVEHRFPLWGTATDLLTLMDPEPAGGHRFRAPTYPDPPHGTFFEFAKQFSSRNVIEGGQLLGALISVAAKQVPDKRLTSAYATFISAATFDVPLDIDVEVLRDGRTIAVVDVKMHQAGKLRCAGIAMLDVGSAPALDLVAPMPDIAGPYESPPLDMGVWGRDLREVDGSYRARSGEVGPAEVDVWARFREAPGEQYTHQALLAQATTHWTIAAAMRPEHGMSEADAHRTVSTGPLSISIAFHDDVDATQWMLYVNPVIHSGRGLSQGEGHVFGIDGRLLASYSLQAMIRPFTAPADSVGGSQRAM